MRYAFHNTNRLHQKNATKLRVDTSTERHGKVVPQLVADLMDSEKQINSSKSIRNVTGITSVYRKSATKFPVIHSISPFRPFHVLILGGGISGLVAAYTLKQKLKWPCIITLVEKSNRVGGWIHTDQFHTGSIFERGTRSLRPVGKVGRNTLKLTAELGLEDNIIVANADNSKKRYIFANGKIVEMPSSILGLLKTVPPLKSSLLRKLVNEVTLNRGPSEEVSVYDFFTRRFGKEVAQYLGDAFCMGIYGCSSKKLSVKASFPLLWQYEQEYGSVVLGGLLTPKVEDVNYNHPLCQRARNERWSSWSLKNGLGDLPTRLFQVLSEYKNVSINLSSECESLELTPRKQWLCKTKNEQFLADHVISTIPSFACADILKTNQPIVASLLDKIKWTTIGVVNVEYENVMLDRKGFGILTPGCENREVLGIVYDSMVFPSQNRYPNNSRFTVMLGGDRFESFFGKPQDCDLNHLRSIALNELHYLHGIREKTNNSIAYVNENCIPQYAIGHLDLVTRIKNSIVENGLPLTITGNSYTGVSVNDVIFHTQEEVGKFVSCVNEQQVRLGLGCM